MVRNITVGISDELIERMNTLTDVNWSAVTRNCIENYIRQRSAEGLESAISIMRSKKEAAFADGYEHLLKNIKIYSAGELEEFSKAFWNDKHIDRLIKDEKIDGPEEYDELSEKYPVDVEKMKNIVYSKNPDYGKNPYSLSYDFIRGMMEALDAVEEPSDRSN